MNYEKEYKKLKADIEKAYLFAQTDSTKAVLEHILPELKESDGERIRKELLAWLKDKQANPSIGFSPIKMEQWIVWLEKQGHTDGIIEKSKTEKQRVIITETDGNANIDWDTRSLEDAKKLLECGLQYINTELEKQDNQKPYGQRVECLDCQFNYAGECKGSCAMKRNEQNPINKEPKFKVGNWYQCTKDFFGKGVTFDKNTTHYCAEEGCLQDEYGCHIAIVKDLYDNFKLWTIQDAKDGDVLHSIGWNNDCIFIFNGLDNWRFDEPNGDRAVATGYCCLSVSADNMEFGIPGPDCVEVNTVKPATKIQRDLLFQKMHEAGYTFDFEKKELKKLKFRVGDEVITENEESLTITRIDEEGCWSNDLFICDFDSECVWDLVEQKSAWSEEDEQYLLICKNALAKYQITDKWDASIISRWLETKLKSLRPQPKQEWKQENREELTEFENAMMHIGGSFFGENAGLDPNDTDTIKEQAELLLELAPKTESWKPSDEQIGVIEAVINNRSFQRRHLDSLYEQLKKLKGE